MKTKTKRRVAKKVTLSDWAGDESPKRKPPLPKDQWLIVAYCVTAHEIELQFVKRRYAARDGGYDWCRDLATASTWYSFASARKYLRSKSLLRHCEVLNLSRLERLQEKRRQLEADDDRQARLSFS